MMNRWLGLLKALTKFGSTSSDGSLDPELATRLLAVLDEIVSLLEAHEEAHWAGLIRESRDKVAQGGMKGIKSLFSRYGGMGSFNDLIIAQHLSGEAMAAPNDRLYALRSQAYDLAVEARESFRS